LARGPPPRARRPISDNGRAHPGANGHNRSNTVPVDLSEEIIYDETITPRLSRRSIDPSQPGIMARLPRRRFIKAKAADTTPPKMRFVTFKTSYTQAFGRLFVWLAILLSFAVTLFWDSLRRQDTPERRAIRLRQLFEKAGDTFIKIGQHLAMRIDFLPWNYCAELAQMRDRMPPFPLAQAIERVERASGGPLAHTFSQFDPEPVGSTSVGCVYQAILRSGETVVVKVRRPDIGPLFMADFLVFDWLASALEFMTFLRPGFTASIRQEFRQSLLEELDFIQEARYQDSFRRAARKSGERFFTAPQVYFDLCSDEVIVEEFVNGVWLWELLAAVERNDEPTLTLARDLNIDPHLVARRLTWVNFWGWHEHLFFHADPHPDNIIIRPNSELTFIDFGSIGAVDRTKRQALQQNMYYAAKQDPLNMARASLILLEPLPPIDLIDFTKELEAHNWQMLYAFASRESHLARRDRTSAIQWLGLIQVARKYGVVIDFHILRLLRATLLYDTFATRLDKDLNIIDEYRRFSKKMARRIGRRTRRRLLKQVTAGPDDKLYLRLERWIGAGEGLFFRLRHMLAIPSVNFTMLMSKWSFAIFTAVVFLTQAIMVTGVAALVMAAVNYLDAGAVMADGRSLLIQVGGNRFYQLIILFLLLINARSLFFRLDDKDI
jgi:ubiquinone biosynthesis protein